VIEIVCPSCQARYELPDNSIGPEGRKVSCSSCQHKWRAFPEGMEPAAGGMPSDAEPEPVPQPVPQPAMIAASGPSGDSDPAPASFSQPPAATGSREDQLAAIRRMLSDLKESADSAPTPEPKAAEVEDEPIPAVAGASRGFYRDSAAEERQDPLKARITQVDHLGKAVKGEAAQTNYDAAQLRKRHEKRAKQLQRARERRRKSGGFLTGFTLVAMVASVVVGLYVLHPQIIAASPELEPAMNQYVTTIDRYRVELGEKTEVWKAWLSEKVESVSAQGEQPKQ